MISEDNLKKAHYIYDTLRGSGCFMTPGRRNDDAVDFSIACHVIGLDPLSEFQQWATENNLAAYKIGLCEEHFERIAPYLIKWGPKDHEDDALDYLIRCW